MCIRDRSNQGHCTQSSEPIFFFFQAEDGIRDHAQSRGLGDVYKRQQLQALEEFKKLVDAAGPRKPIFDDNYLLRFLRARKFDLPKAQEMWNNFLKWRKENDVDNIDKYNFEEHEKVDQVFPRGFYKTDKAGRPIYIERIGLLDIQKIYQVTSEERLLKHYIQTLEELVNKIFPICSQAAGERVGTLLCILDIKGVQSSLLSKKVYNFIQQLIGIAQNNYPEILGRIYIVNAPMMFQTAWGVIKPWLEEKTAKKVTLVGGKFEETLLEQIAPENLPDFLGGKSKESITANPGPWAGQLQYTKSAGYTAPVLPDDDDDEEAKVDDLSQLRGALSGMNLSHPAGPKGQVIRGKVEVDDDASRMNTALDNNIGQTPMNTQMDEDSQNGQESLCSLSKEFIRFFTSWIDFKIIKIGRQLNHAFHESSSQQNNEFQKRERERERETYILREQRKKGSGFYRGQNITLVVRSNFLIVCKAKKQKKQSAYP
eukprot:TRINITY_DN10956_c0_g1_i2.p1 TRINITY_DN10956_c0_g1~~TRINITY_DN10956_c0_g1_i2.p1  ORF type:complete len:484 (+),score=114.66 TRINITY_DN10956_c0_g1_i2:3-1454(+)